MDDFCKFPSTPHLALFEGVVVRGDKVMSEAERNEFLRHELIVEEKVDGANLGLSFDLFRNLRAQNRGSYLQPPYSGQWKHLSSWLAPRIDVLFEQLADRYVLFGEWCYAQHSVRYDQLPDWFLGFDILDKKEERFFSCHRRDEALRALRVSPVPVLRHGHFLMSELNALLAQLQSRIGNDFAEGFYLRFDQGDWLQRRAKLVRPAFIQLVEQHWSRSSIKANRLRPVAN